MATQQPAKQDDKSQKQIRRGIFPRWLRIVAFILMLVFFIVAAIVFIRDVWGNQSNVLSAFFTAIGAIFGLIALVPFFFSSRKSEVPVSTPTPSLPVQVFVTQTQYNSPQTSPEPVINNVNTSDASGQGTNSGSNLPASQQSSSPDLPFQRNEIVGIDKNDLLNRLSSCPAGVFSKVVSYLDLPDGVLSGEKTSQAERAAELIKWAIHPDGPSLQILYASYLLAIGKDPKVLKKSPDNSQPGLNSSRHIQLDKGGEDEQTSPSLALISEQNSNTTPVPFMSEVTNTLAPSDVFLKQARNDLTEAQRCVREASAPFNEKTHIVPRQFREASKLLKIALEHIELLRRLLDETSPLPVVVATVHQSINNQINIVAEQIEVHLIPHLDQNIQGNFTLLMNALNEIGKLIPEKLS